MELQRYNSVSYAPKQELSRFLSQPGQHFMDATEIEDGDPDPWDFHDLEKKLFTLPLFEQYLRDLGGVFREDEDYANESEEEYADAYETTIYESRRIEEDAPEDSIDEIMEQKSEIMPNEESEDSVEPEVSVKSAEEE